MSPSTPFLVYSLILILHRATSLLAAGPHIADFNILLPPRMTHPVEYRLRGTDGCFKWSWDHHDILSVFPEYNSSTQCSTSARLKSIAPYGGRKETAVYATDLNTGMVIRCKVYIDRVFRIQIFHDSIKLDLDGLSALRVRGFDSEENVFSSLVGLQFMWQLIPEMHGSSHSLVHVPLVDSPLSDCGGLCGDLDIQVRLEESGVFSDVYVVKGTEIGHESVYVKLLEPSMEHLEDKIVLTVAEAMSLDPPSPVYVLIGAVVHYTLKVTRSNIHQAVSLPSQFHQWSILNSSVAQVDRATGTVEAFNLGVTTVVVEDTRVVGHMQISSLHVVLPDNLRLFMSPFSPSGDHVDVAEPIPPVTRWYVVAGRLYLIHIKVFTPGPRAHEILLTENDEIELHDKQDELWNILLVPDADGAEKDHRLLKANSSGLGKLTATLTYSTGQDNRKEVLKVVQEVMVCDQVKFIMEANNSASQQILLPWVPGVYQELELQANGGCAMSSSDYKWFSSDWAVVSVSASGIIQARKPGKAIIKAVSIFDSMNYDEVVIEVSIPSSMIMLPDFPMEVPVGSHLQACVTMKASSGAYFYACDAFRSSVFWKTESKSFVVVNSTEGPVVSGKQESSEFHSSSYGPPCAWTLVYASNSGHAMVHATLTKASQQYDHTVGGSIALKTSSRIAAYSPLIVHQVSDGNQFGGYSFDLTDAEFQNQSNNLDDLYLVPGTHLDVMLHGGPERWGKDVEFIENVEVSDASHVTGRMSIHQMSTIFGNPYRIGCEASGTFKLVFRRGNLMGEGHQLPVVSEVQLILMCTFPSSIVIIADEPLNAPLVIQSAAVAERLPGRIRASPIKVANGRRIRISAVGLSDSGKAFANSSSLSLTWELTDCEGLVLLDDVYFSTASLWERFLLLQNKSGLCIVRSTVVGFINSLSHLDFYYKMSGKSTDFLTDAVRLQLVSSLRVNPEFSLLFFNREARLNISITGGSCSLETVVNDTQTVEVIQQTAAYECSQVILAPKNLGSALVTVHDVGVTPFLAASATVQVAEIDWIKLLTGEHISIQEGSFQTINFLVGVGEGHVFEPSQYMYMNIHIQIEDDILEVVQDHDFHVLADRYVHAPNFTLQASRLGQTTIYLSTIQYSGHEILSQPVKVEVYARPRLHPSDIFLVPGASFVVTVRGGPKIGSHIKYASMDDQAAKIDEVSGRVLAVSPGNSTFVATIYGHNDIVLCRAYGYVKVGVPSSAILYTQSEQLAVGSRVPIYPSLSEGNLFSFYELCNNYTWTVGNEDVLNFKNRAHNTGHNTVQTLHPSGGQDLNFIQVLLGVSSGKTDVKVSFSCDYKFSKSLSKSMFYSASMSLWVVSDLPLALGLPITWILPPHYTSSDLLPLSTHAYGKGDSLNDKGVTYSLLESHKRKADKVHEDVIHIDGSKIVTEHSGSLACIQAKDRLSGRTEIASCVRVAEVDQIRIMTDEFPVHAVAVGDEIVLPVKCHDNLGIPFYEAHNIALFEVATNYPDVVSIDENSSGGIRVLAKSQGIALVRVAFLRNPQKSIYAVISSGPQLYPQNLVMQQGSGVNFNVKGLNDSSPGQWFSANESIVLVDRLSGKAEAVGEGATIVHFMSSDFKLHTSVTVLRGNLLSVNSPGEILTNVPFPVKGYAFSVKFGGAYNHSPEATEKNKLLFDCAVDPPNIGFAKPFKDIETGNSYCMFIPHSPEHLARSAADSGDSLHHVSVSVRASLRGDPRVSGFASALFIGGFIVLEMDKNSLHLNLTDDSSKSVLTIIGNTDVKLNWHNKNRLSLRPIHREDPALGKYVQYEIKVHNRGSFKDQLVFSLPAIHQRVEIDVTYDSEDSKAVAKPGNVTIWAGASFLLLLILTVTVVICYLDRPDRSPRPTASTSAGVAVPVTPERSSPAVIEDHSPRTPQPFLDYVRQTIDETPYYRQDFRRRANPQNTF